MRMSISKPARPRPSSRVKQVSQEQQKQEELELEPESDDTSPDPEGIDIFADDMINADMDRIQAKYEARATSPLRAIRAFCVICMGCQPRLVSRCPATSCALHKFRFGKNPFQKHAAGAKTKGKKSQ